MDTLVTKSFRPLTFGHKLSDGKMTNFGQIFRTNNKSSQNVRKRPKSAKIDKN